jgi:hypothetical protein
VKFVKTFKLMPLGQQLNVLLPFLIVGKHCDIHFYQNRRVLDIPFKTMYYFLTAHNFNFFLLYFNIFFTLNLDQYKDVDSRCQLWFIDLCLFQNTPPWQPHEKISSEKCRGRAC